MTNEQWEKDFGPHHIGDRDFLIVGIITFVIISLFLHEPILYVVIGVLLTYIMINIVYNRTVGKKLYMDPKRQTIRLFQGDKSELSFELENDGLLPMIHGQFRFQTTSVIKALEGDVTTEEQAYAFHKTFSIRGKGKTIVYFPFVADRRGVARVRNITYSFPHLFNFNVLTLKYLPFTLREVVVFPKPLKVDHVDIAFQMAPGEHRVQLSPFEDVLSPISTRDYEYSDPFYRINWKASAKTQELQTNVYEKVVDTSYLFLVNIRPNKDILHLSENLENVLSYTTYICQQAFENDVPYELFVNARTASEVPFLQLPEGSGRTHYLRSLEMLARIPRHSMTYSFAEMIYRVKKQVSAPKTVVIIGDIPEEAKELLAKWSQRQKDIYQVVPYEDGAVMEKWDGDVRLYA